MTGLPDDVVDVVVTWALLCGLAWLALGLMAPYLMVSWRTSTARCDR